MFIDKHKNIIINNENKLFKKFKIYASFDINEKFTIYFCLKKISFITLKNPVGYYSDKPMKRSLSRYLHDSGDVYSLDAIFYSNIVFASINNKIVGKEEIKQQLESMRIINMLTKNYNYDSWYPENDFWDVPY